MHRSIHHVDAPPSLAGLTSDAFDAAQVLEPATAAAIALHIAPGLGCGAGPSFVDILFLGGPSLRLLPRAPLEPAIPCMHAKQELLNSMQKPAALVLVKVFRFLGWQSKSLLGTGLL